MIRTALLVLLVAGASACVSEAKVTILEPGTAAMLPAGQPVVVRVLVEGDEALVGDQTVGKGTHDVTVPAADGLGFVTARVPGDPLIAVRSWHQGVYRPARDWHAGTLALHLGQDPLGSGPGSVAGLVSGLLTGEELEAFVPDPLQTQVSITLPVVGAVSAAVNISVTSVVSPDVTVDLVHAGDGIALEAVLLDVPVTFTATAVSYPYSCTGTALYDEIRVTGSLTATATDAVLSGVQSSTVGPDITCSGALPLSEDLPPVQALLAEEVPPAIAAAAQAAASAVLPLLLRELTPTVGIDFDQPITVDTRPGTFAQLATGIDLAHDTRIAAATPAVAAADHGVLERLAAEAADDATGLTVAVGSALINAIAFSVWDAGNLQGLQFTKDELEALGMAPLEFPYDKLQSVDLTLLLPPLLEWDATGPRLDVGGIEIALSVETMGSATAWTAASVPVRLVPDGTGLRLEPDPDRAVTLRDVGFDRMSDLADTDKVMTLLETAVPGVITSVFGTLPTLELRPIPTTRLSGDPGPVVVPALVGVEARADSWRLSLVLGLE